MTKSKITALLATLALGAFAAGCSTATNENMNKPANTTAPANTTKPANMAPPANSNMKMPANSNMKMPPPKASATKKP
jgi:PBP1b-binding outer membrane lipoprotein LpoB